MKKLYVSFLSRPSVPCPLSKRRVLMASFAIVTAIAFFAISLFGQNSKAYSQSSGKVTMIGDSITVGAEPYLTKEIPGVTINAQAGRTWDQGLQVLNSMGTVGDTVVFALGTNSGVTSSQIQALKSAAQGKKIVLMTIYGTSTSSITSYMASSNKAINGSGLTIADWYTKAKAHQSWFSADPLGVHPNAAGSQEFAKIIASAVSSAGSRAASSATSDKLTIGFPASDAAALFHRST
jgi:lysophospholipase L1-like esterase